MTDNIRPDEDEPKNSDDDCDESPDENQDEDNNDYDEDYDEEPVLGTRPVGNDDVAPESKGVGLGFVVSGFIIASLLGGIIGIVGQKFFQHPGQAQKLRAEMQIKIDRLTQAGDDLNNTVADLKAQLQDQRGLIAKLQNKDAELAISLQQQQNNVLAKVTQQSPDAGAGAGVKSTSNLPKNTRDPSGDNLAQHALDILKDTFPREKLLAAAQAQDALAQKKPGWLRRILRKHIKVREQTVLDPYDLIDTAGAALAEGRVQDAIDAIAKLNPAVRSSTADWVRAAQKSLEKKPLDKKPQQ